MEHAFSLKNKKILITGASSGIGRAIAIECSKLGALLIITGRNEERLQNTFDNLNGSEHHQIIADLNTPEGIQQIIAGTEQLSGVVFCAGIAASLPFQFYTIDKVKPVMDTNFFSPLDLCLQLVKNKKINKSGASMVFISSISGTHVSYPGNSIYSASKAAINGLIKGIAIDLAPKKIRVNAVSPAMIETPMINILEEQVSKEAVDADKKRYPLGRYGLPEEVAHGVIYLLSDASSWSTGTNLIIDGGLTLL